jgi:hypothetical protein
MAIRSLRIDHGQSRQQQKTLHLLTLSGVVRSSHMGLRYRPIPPQAEEEPTVSQNDSSVPAHAFRHLNRVISVLHRWKTQLLSREPQYLQISGSVLRRATASRMCLRG